MSELTLTGDKLVVAIRREHEAASAAARSALEHALECGRLLAQARADIPHGGWENYLRDVCGIAPRTGRLYLRLHEHRGRLEDRQRVAGLTVREAARLVAEPRPEEAKVADEEWDILGKPYMELSPAACQFNPDWLLVPCGSYGVAAPSPPRWFKPGHRHCGIHESGWCFEVSPDPVLAGRVNVIAHDSGGTLHLTAFDGMSPAGILPLLLACERHHAMPRLSDCWEITTSLVPQAVARLAKPFPLQVFDLATRLGNRCSCWMLVDEVIGEAPSQDNPGLRAWKFFGHTLGLAMKAGFQ